MYLTSLPVLQNGDPAAHTSFMEGGSINLRSKSQYQFRKRGPSWIAPDLSQYVVSFVKYAIHAGALKGLTLTVSGTTQFVNTTENCEKLRFEECQ